MGSFLFRWPHPDANDVHVTGTFDDWSKSVRLEKKGDLWEKEVELAPTDKSILYKFVVNDQWIIDPEAPQQDDGHGNLNNVLHPDQIKPKAAIVPEALTTSSAAPTSTTAALAGQVPLEPRKEATEVAPESESSLQKETTKTSLPGTFPDTPMTEPDSFSVNPIPATSGAGNPVNVPAGEKVPPPSDLTSNTVTSNVTTSQEDYEKAGSNLPFIGGALAALGLGGAAAASSKNEHLIPESSLPMGNESANILSDGPTISSVGPTSTTADLAGQVPLEDTHAAAATVPEVVKESITEAHRDPEAAASAEAVKEKAEVEEELLKKITNTNATGESAPKGPTISSAAPTSTTANLAGQVPLEDPHAATSAVPEVVKESISEAHRDPEAAASAEAVKEKAEVEEELLKKVPDTNATGEPAPTLAAATSSTAPATETPQVGTADPTLADEPAVQMMNKNAAEDTSAPAAESTAAATTTSEAPKAASESKPAEATASTPSATTTPKKAAASPASTPPTSAAKDKKKKHRLSSFFKKIIN